MFRNILIFISIVAAISVVTAMHYWQEYRRFEQQPLVHGTDAVLWVRPGDTLASVAARLEVLGQEVRPWHWRLLGRLQQPVIRAGEYRILAGDTPRSLLQKLERGDVVGHLFTIVEGWTAKRLRSELAADSRLHKVTTDADDGALMARLGCDSCAIEGYFLPETYRFERGDRDLDLLARAHQAMRQELAAAWRDRDRALELDSPEQLLVLASLVEAETRVDAERARVAGVFVRRLQRGIRLQTDPTVVYGLDDDFDGRIRRVHLRTDHPWNTYTRHGLPPTPIGLPGQASLNAAANPADGDELYFVARGDGSHHFSATLAEHNRAVARYILGRQ